MFFFLPRTMSCYSSLPLFQRIHLPFGLFSNFFPPPPESVRTGGRTLTSQPKFLWWIDNWIFLTMGLRSRALRFAKQHGKVAFTAGRFATGPAPNETPAPSSLSSSSSPSPWAFGVKDDALNHCGFSTVSHTVRSRMADSISFPPIAVSRANSCG